MYRVVPKAAEAVDPLPDDVPADCWWRDRFPVHSVCNLPDGSISSNMLPTFSAAEVVELGRGAAMIEGRRRVLAAWHQVQEHVTEFHCYRLEAISSLLGERTAPRVVARTTLTENDLRSGTQGPAWEQRITIADHLMDVHGAGHDPALQQWCREGSGLGLRPTLDALSRGLSSCFAGPPPNPQPLVAAIFGRAISYCH